MRISGCDVPTREIGVPAQFLTHGSVPEVRARIGMSAQDIARRVVEWAALTDRSGDQEEIGRPAEAADEASDS